MHAIIKKILIITFSLYLLLMIPDCDGNEILASSNKAFEWKMDSYWEQLENDFKNAKTLDKHDLDSIIEVYSQKIEQDNLKLEKGNKLDKPDAFLSNIFKVSPYVAASESHHQWFIESMIKSRNLIKNLVWTAEENHRIDIYKLLYGIRAATEEIMLISNEPELIEKLHLNDEYSETPSAKILGIKVHSGDMLLSRGTVEVSAFISRGNDFPGNFSHVALLYVDPNTSKPLLIEAHIEKGVAIANLDDYLKDKKFRFTVLRLRSDLDAMKEDPNLPHKAAGKVLAEVHKRHIPYDFKMDYRESKAMFCSEVASFAYKAYGINLWENLSTISANGTANWLSAFGIENFETQMPSDLEYDPKIAIVGEWQNSETLFDDHVYNAVMDVLLEKANSGLSLSYNSILLPIARLIKGFSWLINQNGDIGPIPEGMSATQALKNNTMVDLHKTLRERSTLRINDFIEKNEYRPPYWQLIKIAREEAENIAF